MARIANKVTLNLFETDGNWNIYPITMVLDHSLHHIHLLYMLIF